MRGSCQSSGSLQINESWPQTCRLSENLRLVMIAKTNRAHIASLGAVQRCFAMRCLCRIPCSLSLRSALMRTMLALTRVSRCYEITVGLLDFTFSTTPMGAQQVTRRTLAGQLYALRPPRAGSRGLPPRALLRLQAVLRAPVLASSGMPARRAKARGSDTTSHAPHRSSVARTAQHARAQSVCVLKQSILCQPY
eukprot:SAG11_NODE_5707_length_1482_cov_1.981200_2_plen_194_part_00